MEKVDLLDFFQAFANAPHHIAAVHMLQRELDAKLLDQNADWVVCFEAETEYDPQPEYNI